MSVRRSLLANSLLVIVFFSIALFCAAPPARAADTPTGRSEVPVGTLTIGVHVTLVNRWLDPEETEALITPFMVLYALPEIDDLFQRQAKELDRKQREATLHQIQKIVADRVLVAPIFQQAFLTGVGPRVEEAAMGLIQGYPYTAPAEDLKVKP
jgi:hypothetical protein